MAEKDEKAAASNEDVITEEKCSLLIVPLYNCYDSYPVNTLAQTTTRSSPEEHCFGQTSLSSNHRDTIPSRANSTPRSSALRAWQCTILSPLKTSGTWVGEGREGERVRLNLTNDYPTAPRARDYLKLHHLASSI